LASRNNLMADKSRPVSRDSSKFLIYQSKQLERLWIRITILKRTHRPAVPKEIFLLYILVLRHCTPELALRRSAGRNRLGLSFLRTSVGKPSLKSAGDDGGGGDKAGAAKECRGKPSFEGRCRRGYVGFIAG